MNAAEAWNARHGVGIQVWLTDDFGMLHQTRTRSVAWTLGHGDAVVKVEGWAGGYLLGRIKAHHHIEVGDTHKIDETQLEVRAIVDGTHVVFRIKPPGQGWLQQYRVESLRYFERMVNHA